MAKNIAAYELDKLAIEAQIPTERLGELACEADSPTFIELVKLAKVMPLDADELAQISRLKPKRNGVPESKLC